MSVPTPPSIMAGNATGLPVGTISESGKPPESRLTDFNCASAIVAQLIRGDEERNKVRARVKGIVDGNPPYDAAQMIAEGRASDTNINFREAEAFLATALSAFYDLFSEAPTYAIVRTKEGRDPAQQDAWSNIITEEFDTLQKGDETFDSLIQISHHEMVMFGTGPVMFEDEDDWHACGIKSGSLLLPDRAMANLAEWEMAVVRCSYPVGKLFKFIQNPEAAKAVGWNVEATRAAILNAMPDSVRANQDWEFHQQRIRNNDLYYSAQCSVVRCAHVFVKEFDGKITQAIVLEREADQGGDFLFRKVGRFERWQQVIHPMYYDKGDGFHHSVKGLGVKMYSVMELKNRLRCALVDAAFARSQILLQPSASSEEVAPVVQMGPWCYIPPNHHVVQHVTAGVLDAPMAVERDLEGVLQANLSQYRQRLDKPQGNPRTAYEVSAIVSQQASLGKTQISRYLAQEDDFYDERYRRALKSNDEKAKQFRECCKSRGVPESAMRNTRFVRATRVVGQGSAMLRQQVLTEVLQIIAMLPEAGRLAVLRDWVASRVGQEKAMLYVPQSNMTPEMQDQASFAKLENSALKVGAPVLRTQTQDDVVHAAQHIEASSGALGSLQQGGDPVAVLSFVDMAGAHIAIHLQALSADPARKQEFQVLKDQWEQLSQTADKLRATVKARMDEQAKQQQEIAAARQQAGAIEGGTDPDTIVKTAQAKQDMAIKGAKASQQIRLKEQKAASDKAIKDAQAAAKIAQPQPAAT